MGEYAKFRGGRIKIGTCENMYYLRADQAHLVTHEPGNVNPTDAGDLAEIRFRFPWPDEDKAAPGTFDRHDRGLGLYGVAAPEGVEHGTVQFSAPVGYLVSLPCPEGSDAGKLGVTIHRNGFAGPVMVTQQAWRDGKLVTICKCGGCGHTYRLPALADAEPVIVAIRSLADQRARDNDESAATWHHTVADRIAAGYALSGRSR